MNLDDLKSEEVDPDDSEDSEEETTPEEDIGNAISILEDCAKFIETILIGVTLSDGLKGDVDTLLEDIYSFTSQYDIEGVEEDGEGKPL